MQNSENRNSWAKRQAGVQNLPEQSPAHSYFDSERWTAESAKLIAPLFESGAIVALAGPELRTLAPTQRHFAA